MKGSGDVILHIDKRRLAGIFSAVLALLCVAVSFYVNINAGAESEEKSFIKWAEMNVCLSALEDTMKLDVESYGKLYHISWIESLSYLACKNGDKWGNYKKAQLEEMVKLLGEDKTIDELMSDNKYYSYYKQVFTAMLSGFLGVYEKEAPDGEGGKKKVSGYGLIAYSPVAEGFSYSHYDDFGASRDYGYRRSHLGNDLMGYVGTPVVAVEGGTVECIGWNRYGGWRLGIRSHDGKRSYYYAHLRKDTPYAVGIKEGAQVKPGQVIGYMGMTGYSEKENTNGMTTPHLHFGIQLIFDESQKEGTNQIWLDAFTLVKFLSRNRATVVRDDITGEYLRKYDINVATIDF